MRTLIPLLTLATLVGCSEEEVPETCEARPAIEGIDDALQSNEAFAWDLYGEVSSSPGNLFFSPLSISSVLSMTLAGARGETADEMRDVLSVQGDDASHHAAMGALIADLDGSGCGSELSLANRLFGQQGFAFEPDFLAINAEDYGAPLGEVDFVDDTEGARQEINGWVADHTKDRIDELLVPGILDTATRLVLANAVAFEGDWAAQFDPAATADRPFAAPGGSIDVPTMSLNAELPMGYVDGVQVLQLPYFGEEASMLVALPEDEDVAAMEAGLDADTVAAWIEALSLTQVDVLLPKFELEHEIQLADALKALGMVQAFEMGIADLSGMAPEPMGDLLYVQDTVHKAFVMVNEEGTEAAAASAVVVGLESAGPVFFANRPFVFLIRDDITGATLFIGRIEDPRG